MPTRYDKVLVTHGGALRRKYGVAGAKSVRAALDALVAADARRGLLSRVLLLDNAASMRAVRATPVPDGDWVAALRAVDLAATRWLPAYIALVGATDVVPQAHVRNPLGGLGDDMDPFVPSDLPYACDLPDGWTAPAGTLLDAGDLLAVTRVVGRIPDIVGATEPSMLLAALATAATYTQRKATAYQRVFSLSAAAWKGSTTQTVDLLPGPSPVTQLSPPAQTGWGRRDLSPRLHLVNCHGGDTTPDWFGQVTNGPIDTVALAPEDIDGRITAGTVVASECCYGAMHHALTDIGGRLPLLWAYLRSGGYAGVGSSTTSYGPADGNGQADLVCRYVLEGILAGASSGRALLDARQRFVRELGALGPEDLKTLAQFDLLGDPSLQAVALAGRPVGTASPKTAAGARSVADAGVRAGAAPQAALARRRVVLAASGRALAASVPRAGRLLRRTGAGAAAVTAADLGREAGVPARVVGEVRTFGEHRAGPRTGARFHVAPVAADGSRGPGFVVSREVDGQRVTQAIWAR